MGKIKPNPQPAPAPVRQTLDGVSPSVGNLTAKQYPAAKTTGVKMRGTGAATKGTMSRGPMG